MAATLTAEVLQDHVAVSLARTMATANKRARELGVDVIQSLITITQHISNGTSLWRVNYGPKDYVGRRGGDLIRVRSISVEVRLRKSSAKRLEGKTRSQIASKAAG